MSLDLKPEKVKPYLKMITEAIMVDSGNKGSLRKLIWDYLLKKYQRSIDYRDFLLAIRKFLIDGKMINKEGYFSMHPEVINEVKEKTPTPAFKKQESASPMVKDGSAMKRVMAGIKRFRRRLYKESARQSKIQRYFQRKQMEPFGMEALEKPMPVSKGLGFQTPAVESKKSLIDEEMRKEASAPPI